MIKADLTVPWFQGLVLLVSNGIKGSVPCVRVGYGLCPLDA
jgi:hypothetical protein